MSQIRIGATVPGALPIEHARNPSEPPVVVYIHPEGRFYVLRFTFPGGSYNEAMDVSPAELEEMRKAGIVKRPNVLSEEDGLMRLLSAFKNVPDIDVDGKGAKDRG